MRTLEASLQRKFRTIESEVGVGERIIRVLHPASAEELISEADFERDERLPYWAELWPSARVLGEAMLGMTGTGRTLLELGCGAGLVTTCAALAGFSVTASDYYDDATRFAQLNAWRNQGGRVIPLSLDWRRMPKSVERFDMVIASDVLYERPYGELVARVIGTTLAADGTAIVADPGRVGREAFLRALPEAGLRARTQRAVPYVNGEIRQTITLFEIGRL